MRGKKNPNQPTTSTSLFFQKQALMQQIQTDRWTHKMLKLIPIGFYGGFSYPTGMASASYVQWFSKSNSEK